MAGLPNQGDKQLNVPNLDEPVTVERSAKEVHEAYLRRIQQMQAIRKQAEEFKKQAEMQESIIQKFTKKPTLNSPKHGAEEAFGEATTAFDLKRPSKSSVARGATPVGLNSHDGDEDLASQSTVYRPQTPIINEKVLETFDQRKHPIRSLIQSMQ